DIKAEESIRWTPESEERMKRVPPLVQGIARTAIYRLAVEKGHSVITSDLLDEAMDRYMPKGAKATTKLAESVVLEHAKERPIAICRKCGVSAAESEPVVCSVCGGKSFEVISPEAVAEIIKLEGGAEAETTYDGKKLTWTRDAKRGLWTMKDAYKRRRTKARIEKAARMRRLATVTLEFAKPLIEEETGVPLVMTDETGLPPETAAHEGGKKLVARDDKQNPLFSELDWAADAIQRILRVPAGFMRNRTQQRIEDLARDRGQSAIDLALVEEGIEHGRKLMEETIRGYQADPRAARAAASPPADPAPAPLPAKGADGLPLNEVGIMAVLEAKRQGATDKA
ncbi:MAG: PCP reductase family protein, partial [Candidatus Binatia bacterium]